MTARLFPRLIGETSFLAITTPAGSCAPFSMRIIMSPAWIILFPGLPSVSTSPPDRTAHSITSVWPVGRYTGLLMCGTAQDLIVSPTALNILEGGAGVFTVRLAAPPAGNVTVDVTRTAGDSNLTVASSPALTFTAANYATPQIVYVTAAEDSDTINDFATFTVSSTGLASQSVSVNAIDNDDGLLLSTSVLNINEGATGTFSVSLSDPPTGTVTR